MHFFTAIGLVVADILDRIWTESGNECAFSYYEFDGEKDSYKWEDPCEDSFAHEQKNLLLQKG